ncbi:MAG: metallophosphatase [Armatimonadota bacterium]
MRHIVIFHTSDIHNRFKPRHAEFIRHLRENTPDSLVLDSGDAIWAGNIFWRPGGEPVLELMSDVPYDAMCMGNREFHFLGAGLKSKICRARFPILSANLHRSDKRREKGFQNRPNGLQPYVILERCGLRIGVMGLTVPCITAQMKIRYLGGFFFSDPVKKALEVIPELRPRCDLLIALTHVGIQKDMELAEKVPGIDLILGGHTHIVAEETVDERGVTVLHHGCHGKVLGKVDVEVSAGTTYVNRTLIPLPGV